MGSGSGYGFVLALGVHFPRRNIQALQQRAGECASVLGTIAREDATAQKNNGETATQQRAAGFGVACGQGRSHVSRDRPGNVCAAVTQRCEETLAAACVLGPAATSP